MYVEYRLNKVLASEGYRQHYVIQMRSTPKGIWHTMPEHGEWLTEEVGLSALSLVRQDRF